MESNTNERDLSQAEIELDEPHFDETTLLSARPVVPLAVVEAKSRSLNRVLIGSAIVVALFIGALAATFIYRFGGEAQTTAETATNNVPAQSASPVEGGIAAVEEPEPVAESETEPTPSDKKQTTERTIVRNAPAKSPPSGSTPPPRRVARDQNKAQNDEAQYETLEDDIARQRELDEEMRRAQRREERRAQRREERRADTREERRPRRVEKEAKHQGGDRSTDDLLRIREIFEGRPKP